MMKLRYWTVVFLCCICLDLAAQKPALNFDSRKHWTSADDGKLSGDGKYVCYTIYGEPINSKSLVVETTTGDFKKILINASDASFSSDSKKMLFRQNDSLVLFNLVKKEFAYIPKIADFKLTGNENNSWLIYKTLGRNKYLVRNLSTGSEKEYAFDNYSTNQTGETLIIQVNGADSIELQVLNLKDGTIQTVWSGLKKTLVSYVTDKNAHRFALLVANGNKTANQILMYKPGENTIETILDLSSIEQGYEIAGLSPGFDEEGNRLFIQLQKQSDAGTVKKPTEVNVWSYTDAQVQSLQSAMKNQPPVYTAVVDLANNKFIWLTEQDEEITGQGKDLVLIRHQLGFAGMREAHYNKAAQPCYYLVSTKDGARKLLRSGASTENEEPSMSPTGKWVIYFDKQKGNFFSYEVSSGIKRDITRGANTNWIRTSNDQPKYQLNWLPSYSTWLKGDEEVLIYDNYDIWLIDPSAKKAPLNFTNGYGAKHKIKFSLLQNCNDLSASSTEKNSTILLNAFNEETKERGVSRKVFGTHGNPEMCTMGPHQYGFLEYTQDITSGLLNPFQKAKSANVYLVTRMSATEAPNYFVTKDFKSFRQLTNVQPQKQFNWYTTELHSWKSLDGTALQGILYKPENFDPSKKYPVIFYYYERRSDGLNMYLHVKPSDGDLNIPLFVSNGYLIFSPDIKYKTGEPGQSAYNAVVSAANYLSKFSWVDKKKMGLQGHSWGGYETNFIVTHSNLFAAACSAAGVSDMVSMYGSGVRGTYAIYHAEKGQGRMGIAPWENPGLYVKNSPIFFANRVSSPLLMMNNKDDRQVPFSQGVEFYSALRRLGKRVWMLQYDDEDHTIDPRSESTFDYHIRMMQFFDHYLKDSACPRWMLYGIPAKDKGVIDGLDLIKEKDPKTGKWLTPKEGGLLTEEERKKVEALKHRKPVTITIE